MFVLLDLIGSRDTQFQALKKDTQLPYNRLVRIEQELRRMQALRGGSKAIFQDKRNYWSGIQDDHLPFERRGQYSALPVCLSMCLSSLFLSQK